MRTLTLALAVAGCTPPLPSEGPSVRYDPDSVDGYRQPWPGDQHLRDDGTIDFTAFQRRSDVALLDLYIDAGATQRGWGTNSPIHFSLRDEPLYERLPTPAQSLEPDAAIVLVDVDPASPYRGERFPVVWHRPEVVSAYQPEGMFSVAPAPGFPLRGGTTYAVLLTGRAFAVTEAFQDVFEPDHPHHALWEKVDEVLPDLGLRRRDIAGGSVFTTMDPVDEMARIARFLRDTMPPANLAQDVVLASRLATHDLYIGRYPSPVFTFGERPYTTSGGGFRFDDQGQPLVAGFDDMRLAVCVPRDQVAPPEGWPVVIYQHGTGGDFAGVCSSNATFSAGRVLAEEGFVVLGIDQPLHGSRNGGAGFSEIANFNVLNPDSGRTNFRQGAADAIYLARSLATEPARFTLPDGTVARLDPEQVHYMGHSQGGMTGAIAAAFWGGDVGATVLSGAGGLLSITIVDRKDIFDFALLVSQLARFAPGEEVHELHPVVGLVQMLVEPTDMINYAPYWFSQPLDHPAFADVHTPSSVLVTSGTADPNTPYRSAIAMAAAARTPPLPPRATSLPALDLRGLSSTPTPAADNADAFDGPITAGFVQWRDGSHFIVFEEPPIVELYRGYLSSSAQGAPLLALPVSP